MDWLRENWFWIAVGVFFIWMHTKMHGGHGAHGGHGGHGGQGGGGCGGHGGRGDREPRNESDARREHDHAQH